MIELRDVILPVAPSLLKEGRQHLSLQLSSGQFCRVCGPAGSGKTALLNLLALRSAFQGGLSLFGHAITTRLSHKTRTLIRQRIGYLEEVPFLSPQLTLFENIALPLSIQKAARRDIIHETTSILSWLSLDHCRDIKPSSLSSSERLRAACARALIARPSLLLLEGDPMCTDPELCSRLLPALGDFIQSGTTIVLTTRHADTFEGLLPTPSLYLPHQPKPSFTENEPSFFSPPQAEEPPLSARESLMP